MSTMSWYCDYITSVKGVQGGERILKGTRTPVRSVAVLYHFTYNGDLAKVQAALPHPLNRSDPRCAGVLRRS